MGSVSYTHLEFERGVQLARQGQAKLQQAEQRVQILLSDNEDACLTPFTPDNESVSYTHLLSRYSFAFLQSTSTY